MVFGNDPKFLFDHKCPIFKGLVVTASGLESSVREKVFSLSRPAATVIEGCVLTIVFIFRSRRFWRLKAANTAARWTRTGAHTSSYRNRKEQSTSSRANGKCTSLHRSGFTTALRVATASTNTITSATQTFNTVLSHNVAVLCDSESRVRVKPTLQQQRRRQHQSASANLSNTTSASSPSPPSTTPSPPPSSTLPKCWRHARRRVMTSLKTWALAAQEISSSWVVARWHKDLKIARKI